jgi:hypothetical protein
LAYGFSVTTGQDGGGKVTISDQDIAPGLWLDMFDVAYETTVSKSYSPASGSQLLVQSYSQASNLSPIVNISINGLSLTVTVQTGRNTNQVGARIIVMVV